MWIYRILQDVIEKWKGSITSIEVYEGWAAEFEEWSTITLQQKFSNLNIEIVADKKLEIR